VHKFNLSIENLSSAPYGRFNKTTSLTASHNYVKLIRLVLSCRWCSSLNLHKF